MHFGIAPRAGYLILASVKRMCFLTEALAPPWRYRVLLLTNRVVLHLGELVGKTEARGRVEDAREGRRHQADEDAPEGSVQLYYSDLRSPAFAWTHFCLGLAMLDAGGAG